MAKVKSLFNVLGTLGELTFYKDQDGYKVRTKNSVSKERIMNDPAYARTRENLLEFAESAHSGKQLRHAILDLMWDAKDKRVTSRVAQAMSRVKNEDLISARGHRKVAIGIITNEGQAWLKGFEFNIRTVLGSVLLAAYTLDPVTGEIVVDNFIPAQRLNVPQGGTHVSLSCGFLNLDFATNQSQLELSNIVNLPIDMVASTVTLTPAAVPAGTGQAFYFLKVAFFQEMNGTQYPLNNGAFNALQLIEVL